MPMTHVIAHRGASQVERENTVEAFRAAVALGADGIELDARRSADGEIVVHHDALLPDGQAIVATDRSDLPDHIPTLATALDACAGAFVNVEVKNDPSEPDFDPDDRVAEAVVAEIGTRSDGIDRWLISSFRLATVDRCLALAPALSTAWLVHAVGEDTPILLAERGHCAVHPWEPTVTAAVIERCHAAGLAVNTWTCNDPVRAAELAAWAIDGIVSDNVTLTLSALGR